jgi:UDP-N-acetylmuramyl pentapeptide phosphotransferase/UDP-N-acetylglucosamine-1-phosphate transferase
MVDRPDERRIHKGTIPRGGGLAVFVGFHLACAAIYFLPWQPFYITLEVTWWLKFLPASLFLAAIGMADDRWSIQPRVKLGCQVLAALALYDSGIHLGRLFYHPLPWPVDCALTVLWCVGFMNAFNLIDGLDGLATGLGIIAAAGVAGSMVIRHLPGDTLVLLGLIGACLGFLRYNFNPARVFLGDTGSMFIGFALAAISLSTGSKGTVVASMAIPLLAAGVPILDTMLAVWRRSVRHLRQNMDGIGNSQGDVFSADKDHLHHRLLRIGNSDRRVALSLYALNACLVGVGLLSLTFQSFAISIFLVGFVVAVYVIVRHLAHVELWDSGMAVLQGLRRPSSKAVAVMAYPVADIIVLAIALLASLYLTQPLTHHSLRNLWFEYSFVWITPPFLCLAISGTYSRVWSRARPTEYLMLILAVTGGGIMATAIRILIAHGLSRLHLGESAVFTGTAILGLIGIRIFPRIIQDGLPLLLRNQEIAGVPKIFTLIYGAGHNFTLFMRVKSNDAIMQKQQRVVVGLLDDDPNLRGRTVYGCRVLGGIEKLEEAILRSKAQEIVITTFLNQSALAEIERCAKKHKVRIFLWRTDIRSQRLAGIHFSFDRCVRETTSRLLAATPVTFESDLTRILELSATFAEADSCSVAIFIPGTERVARELFWDANADTCGRTPTLPSPCLMRQLREQGVLQFYDVDRLPPEAGAAKAFLQARGAQSAMIVSIGQGENRLGFIGYYGLHSDTVWEEQALSLLKLQADILALTLRSLPAPSGNANPTSTTASEK